VSINNNRGLLTVDTVMGHFVTDAVDLSNALRIEDKKMYTHQPGDWYKTQDYSAGTVVSAPFD